VGNADSIQLQRCQGMAAVGNRFFTAFGKSNGKNCICHASSNIMSDRLTIISRPGGFLRLEIVGRYCL